MRWRAIWQTLKSNLQTPYIASKCEIWKLAIGKVMSIGVLKLIFNQGIIVVFLKSIDALRERLKKTIGPVSISGYYPKNILGGSLQPLFSEFSDYGCLINSGKKLITDFPGWSLCKAPVHCEADRI